MQTNKYQQFAMVLMVFVSLFLTNE